jgi:nucleoid DNA-binding protein
VEAVELVEQVLHELCDTLAAGENVKLSGFGTFTVREKAGGKERASHSGALEQRRFRRIHILQR